MYKYPGDELHLFANAHNWKRYFGDNIRRYVRGDVLDVGAGWGVNAQYLINKNCKSWTFLEPDEDNCSKIHESATTISDYPNTSICGNLSSINASPLFDTILYIDVLEHIADDHHELAQARLRLKREGALIVLVPCHTLLYSEFDRHIGHYRRYSSKDFLRFESDTMKLKKLFYLDSLGLTCSILNRYVLKKELPSLGDIKFWDSYLVPISRRLDWFLAKCIGKSLVAIFEPVCAKD